MTLCIAWKEPSGLIQLATDSRISWLGSGRADVGIKIMSMPIRLYDATPAGTSARTCVHDGVLGLAVIGGVSTVYFAKEFLEQVLAGIQFAGDLAHTSLARIVGAMTPMLQMLAKDVCAVLFENGLGEIIVVGRCPATQTARAFRISIVCDIQTGVQAASSELFAGCPKEFFGSGAARARELYEADATLDGVHLVKSVILEESVPTVGGSVQYGVLESTGFRVKGVRDYRVNHGLREICVNYALAGQEVVDSGLLDRGFVVTSSFVDPFAAEIDHLIDQGYDVVPNTVGW